LTRGVQQPRHHLLCCSRGGSGDRSHGAGLSLRPQACLTSIDKVTSHISPLPSNFCIYCIVLIGDAWNGISHAEALGWPPRPIPMQPHSADLTYSFVTVRYSLCPRSTRISRSHQRSSLSSRVSRFGKELHHCRACVSSIPIYVLPCRFLCVPCHYDLLQSNPSTVQKLSSRQKLKLWPTRMSSLSSK
jgi:hypothetical protein